MEMQMGTDHASGPKLGPKLGPNSALKLDLMFDGLRYTDSLGAAASHAYPNYYPYRFAKGEPDPTGSGKVEIPYLARLPDGTMFRVKGNFDSPWYITGSQADGYQLVNDERGHTSDIEFEPLPAWLRAQTSDNFPMAQTGLSMHADMAVVNIAPGCEYFLKKQDGVSMRCTFCAYGAPDKRTQHLGQVAGVTGLPTRTYSRLQEALRAATSECEISNLYLVAGSLTDWTEEGNRFIEIARGVQEVNQHRIPVFCGSGALPNQSMDQLHAEKLVDGVSFNLEIWSPELFAQICPGKNRYVGYERWIESLEYGVSLWGRGRVYSAMVAGIELEPEYAMEWQAAADLAIQGADDLCKRGIIPIYSLYWPVGGKDHPDYMTRLRAYFERLSVGYRAIREKYDLQIWDGFMTHRSAYMQLECDMDREAVKQSGAA
jgi:hypothetical protein